MLRLKVDIIVLSGGLLPIQAAKNATKTIPILMTGVGADPVKTGLVESLARPGVNVTGITNLEPFLQGMRLESSRNRCRKSFYSAEQGAPGRTIHGPGYDC